jgi:hypothetical protein
MAICPEFEGNWGTTGVCGIASGWGPGFNSSCMAEDQGDFVKYYPPGVFGDARKGIKRSGFDDGNVEAKKIVNNSRCPWLTVNADIPRKLEKDLQT